MRRYRQTLEEVLSHLAPVDTSWRDAHAERVIERLKTLPKKSSYSRTDLAQLFDSAVRVEGGNAREHFDASLTIVRLFLDLSKDEFTAALKDQIGSGIGISRLRHDPNAFFRALEKLGVLRRMSAAANVHVTWTDVLVERLKGGRGSAIKGQRRGRFLEDFVEHSLIKIFGKGNYQVRCQFIGATGLSKEKTDFAVPSRNDPAILIEAKAYGATGSKQTDVLGDISRIVNEKRGDTHFLLVTDGITWRERLNDLRKLLQLQNQGQITRIYTRSMAEQFEADLRELKREHGL